MDNFLFAVLFLACLLSFPENLFGKPASDLDSKEVVWPDKCKENFCCEKPHDYPSEEYLKQLFKKNKSKFPNIPETTDRNGGGDRNVCDDYDYYIENIYMIRMENGDIRYALYIRDMYDIKLQTKPCKTDATEIYQSNPTAMKEARCVNKTSEIPYYPVLSRNMQNIEFIKLTYPSSCKLYTYDKYE